MPDKDPTRDVMRMFQYGLYVVAAAGPAGPRAATVSWVTQSSFEPRLVTVGLRKGTAIHEAVRSAGRFALHVVDGSQMDFARAFFKASESGEGRIGGYTFAAGATGVPVFDVAAAWLECEVIEEVGQTLGDQPVLPGPVPQAQAQAAGLQGDHTLFVARVLESGVRLHGASALLLRDTPWRYGG